MFQDRVRQLGIDERTAPYDAEAGAGRWFDSSGQLSNGNSPSMPSRVGVKSRSKQGLLSNSQGNYPGFENNPAFTFKDARSARDDERDDIVTGRYATFQQDQAGRGASPSSPKNDLFRQRLAELERTLEGPVPGLGTTANSNRFGMHPAFREQISNLRGKLIHVGERFVGFDKNMEELAHMRKVSEEARVQSMIDDLTKLERALNTEVRRRVDYTRTLQIVTENYANEMLDKLQKKLMRQMEQIIAALDSLSARCLTLERGMMQFRGELPSKLMVETDAMARRVADMKKDLQVVADEIRGDGSADRMIGQLEYAIDHQVRGTPRDFLTVASLKESFLVVINDVSFQSHVLAGLTQEDAAAQHYPEGWTPMNEGFTILRKESGFPEYKIVDVAKKDENALRYRVIMQREKDPHTREEAFILTVTHEFYLEYQPDTHMSKVNRKIINFKTSDETNIGKWTPSFHIIKWGISRDENAQWAQMMRIHDEKKKLLLGGTDADGNEPATSGEADAMINRMAAGIPEIGTAGAGGNVIAPTQVGNAVASPL
ncbi:unnamed protein product [Amoebophrya sp. A120]|nr:unnamed protein product [Amoebophrya sp. A120]|eukprot:GSA120T00003788001.1